MFQKALFAVAILAVIVLSISDVEGEHQKGKRGGFKCLGENVTYSEETKTTMKECTEEMSGGTTMSPNDKDDKEKWTKLREKMQCFDVCKLRKLGVLVNDSKHEFDITKYNAMIDATFPEAARAGIKEDAKKCFDAVTEALSDEENCKSHQTYQKCLMKSYKTHCTNEAEAEQ